MLLCLAAGFSVGMYFFWWVLTRPHSAFILDGHIVYVTEYRHSGVIDLGYLVATGLPLILSTQRTVVTLGAIIIVGYAIAYVSYWEAFTSVWCFFAAAASVVILCHFELSRRQTIRIARVS